MKQTCQRCELDVSKKDGIYNLIVQNVRLGEDEYYECQVSPGKTSINSLPLRAPVHLTIQGKTKVSNVITIKFMVITNNPSNDILSVI